MNAIQNLKHYLEQKRLTKWCDACGVSEARHFIPHRADKRTIALCDTCYGWRRKGYL